MATAGHDPAAGTWAEGQDGLVCAFDERLRAPWGAWAFSLFLTGTLGIAYAFAAGPVPGVAAFALTQAVATWALLVTAPRVRVDERVLRAGRARLPRAVVGRVRTLDAATTRRLRGVDTDAAAYLCVRSWVPRAVLVEVRDPADPHPYWLVSTRHPERLAAALAG